MTLPSPCLSRPPALPDVRYSTHVGLAADNGLQAADRR